MNQIVVPPVAESVVRVVLTEYRFEIGTCVTHRDQPMPSLVLTRSKASNGMEIYGLRSFAEVDEQRDRMMLGECLAEPGAKDCGICLLAATGMCPRRQRLP